MKLEEEREWEQRELLARLLTENKAVRYGTLCNTVNIVAELV